MEERIVGNKILPLTPDWHNKTNEYLINEPVSNNKNRLSHD